MSSRQTSTTQTLNLSLKKEKKKKCFGSTEKTTKGVERHPEPTHNTSPRPRERPLAPWAGQREKTAAAREIAAVALAIFPSQTRTRCLCASNRGREGEPVREGDALFPAVGSQRGRVAPTPPIQCPDAQRQRQPQGSGEAAGDRGRGGSGFPSSPGRDASRGREWGDRGARCLGSPPPHFTCRPRRGVSRRSPVLPEDPQGHAWTRGPSSLGLFSLRTVA